MSESAAATRVTTWRAEVFVSLKPVVNDPQGLAIRDGLRMLGYDGVAAVRAGKYIQVWLEAADRAAAEQAIVGMCEKLLANPVIEQYQFSLRPESSDATPPDGRG